MAQNTGYYDNSSYSSTVFFCMNCANLLNVFFNEAGVGKSHCPKCNCDIVLKRYRRKYCFELYEPKLNGLRLPFGGKLKTDK